MERLARIKRLCVSSMGAALACLHHVSSGTAVVDGYFSGRNGSIGEGAARGEITAQIFLDGSTLTVTLPRPHAT
jgi:hypothetical protein